MKVHRTGAGAWFAICTYQERETPKAAGWRWHGQPCTGTLPGGPPRAIACPACALDLPPKVWWTARPDQASKLADHADGASRAELERIAGDRAAAVIASRARDAAIEVPAPPGLAYRPFQKAGIAYALSRKGTLIGDEMGTGKTIQAIGVINADASIASVLVICPATLRVNWYQELRRWLVAGHWTICLPRGRIMPTRWDKIVVVNYEKLTGTFGDRLRPLLMGRDWDLLVVDEAHRLKDPRTQRTLAVLGGKVRDPATFKDHRVEGVAVRARRSIFLTGTPIPNRPAEIFTLLNYLVPGEFGSRWQFEARYCAAQDNGWGRDASGHDHLEELQERMRATCMIRRLKRDVLDELPEKVRQIVDVEADADGELAIAAEHVAYARQEERLAELRATVDLAHAAGDQEAYKLAVAAMRSGAAVAFQDMARVRRETAVAKLPQVLAHVDEILEDGDGKVVLMGHHLEVLNAAARHWGMRAVLLTGETKMEDRMEIVRRFQEDAAVRVFVGSIMAAGVGITLTASSHVVFAELDWVPGNMTQAEDRVHRIGQRSSVLVQHLVLQGSLDAKMARTLVAKQQVVDDALDVEHERALPVSPIEDEPRPRHYPPVDEVERARLHAAMEWLAGQCDGARTRDAAGFSRYDAAVGLSLSRADRLTDGQAWLAAKLARRYRGQLERGGAAPAAAVVAIEEGM